nr:MAG TPA: hypothetical protein [Caudoviricetes sp.]
MDLQNFIYLLFAAVWLSGLVWASVIAFKSRKTNDKTTLKINENLNINVGQMNASKLTTIDLRKDKE